MKEKGKMKKVKAIESITTCGESLKEGQVYEVIRENDCLYWIDNLDSSKTETWFKERFETVSEPEKLSVLCIYDLDSGGNLKEGKIYQAEKDGYKYVINGVGWEGSRFQILTNGTLAIIDAKPFIQSLATSQIVMLKELMKSETFQIDALGFADNLLRAFKKEME